MKQRINLYLDDLRPIKDPLSLTNIVASWLVVLIICIGYTGALFYVNADTKKTLTHIKQKVDQQNASINELQAALSVKQDKNFLSQQLNKLNKEHQHKKMVFEYIAGRNKDNKTSYADVMSDLAEYHHNDIWLTEFQFVNHEIELKGLTQVPSKLPHWFDGLKRSSFFSGKSFSIIEFTNENEGEQVEFRVATRISAEVEGDQP
ncbi:PilN domain-containing protein [Pseudoalteromonas denitrificans]|uniref:Fimbrial assembly protein (PilN) n=1 Tax=Pseudoalteromonas denitrificans DSM 6059 TaxID=1123010 RepID=A0A1I1U5R0_9GAMM|nr:PilN domain-containing protein [Pseudoalteromonas denitrificans]SFD66127.1 Fimbrial assembly protein (PilN) [Pseudoalteromonas denitrificans DSM 6059]